MSESLPDLLATDALLDLTAARRLDHSGDLVLAELGLLAAAVDAPPLPPVVRCWSGPARTNARKGGWALSVTVALMVTSSGVAAAVSENPLAPLHYVSNQLWDLGPRTGGSVPGWDLHGAAPITAVPAVGAPRQKAAPILGAGTASGDRSGGSRTPPVDETRSPSAPPSGGGGSGTGGQHGGQPPSSGPGTGHGQGGNSGTHPPGGGEPPPSNGGHRPGEGSGNSGGPSAPSVPADPGGSNIHLAEPYNGGNSQEIRHGPSGPAEGNRCGIGVTVAPPSANGDCSTPSATTATAEPSPVQEVSPPQPASPTSLRASPTATLIAPATTRQKSSRAASLP